MIIFGSILTTFELSSIFGGSWGSIARVENRTIIGKFSLPKSVKHSVVFQFVGEPFLKVIKLFENYNVMLSINRR
jgi:hypothetical protein